MSENEYPLAQKGERVESDIRRKRKPDDAYTESMLAYYEYLKSPDKVQPGSVEELVFKRIRENEFQREIVEALLIGGCPDDGAADALGISEKAMRWYRELFFDTSVFASRLDLYEYVYSDNGTEDGNGPDTEEGEPPERPLKEAAYEYGYLYILGKYAGGGTGQNDHGSRFASERMTAYLVFSALQAGKNIVDLSECAVTPESQALMRDNFKILLDANTQYRSIVPEEPQGPNFYEIIFNAEEPEELKHCALRLEYIDPEMIV